MQKLNTPKIIKKEWPYWLGGLVLGLVNVFFLFVTWEPLGVTTTMSIWGGALLGVLGFTPGSWDYFSRLDLGSSLLHFTIFSKGTWLNIGITVGALLGALLASQFRIRKVKSIKYAIAALVGGFLMGYGARLAPRCNIGNMFGGVPSLSLEGWVFTFFAFLGAIIGSKLLVRYFLD